MKFVVVNVHDPDLAYRLCDKFPVEVSIYHKLMELLCIKGIPYSVSFHDNSDPGFLDEFKFPERFIYGLKTFKADEI